MEKTRAVGPCVGQKRTPAVLFSIASLRFHIFSKCDSPSIAVNGGIITRARPGDQFVSIDGKRTYFDISPTRRPSSPTRPRPAGQGQVIGATLQIGGNNLLR